MYRNPGRLTLRPTVQRWMDAFYKLQSSGFRNKMIVLFFLIVLICGTIVGALDPIIVRGNKMYNSETGERFYMKGVSSRVDGSLETFSTAIL